jgi:hypothetical protein
MAGAALPASVAEDSSEEVAAHLGPKDLSAIPVGLLETFGDGRHRSPVGRLDRRDPTDLRTPASAGPEGSNMRRW